MDHADAALTQARSTIVVVPCYNEAERLSAAAFRDFLRTSPDVGFVFVDDGSTDATPAVLRGLAGDCPGAVQVVGVPENRGKGEAVRAGMTLALASPARFVGYWDADLATPLDAIAELRAVMERDPGVDLVFGSRVRLLGRTIERNALRHYVGRVFATAVSLLTRLPIYDSQCGAKLFRNSAATRELFAQPFYSRWLFDVELLLRLRDTSRVVEYPLREWRDIAGSKIRPQDVVKVPVMLFRLYLAYLRQR
jgi:glycosyltransferase involved in cell wall biosynthesis